MTQSSITPYPPFQILPASWHDLGSVRRVEQECFGEDAWPLLDILATLSWPGVVRLKALVGQEVTAFAAAEVKGDERIGWINTIGVLKAFRRLGIGAALLGDCEKQLAVKRVRLCVRQSNLGALVLYWNTGYHQVDVWKHYYGTEDALVMEKTF